MPINNPNYYRNIRDRYNKSQESFNFTYNLICNIYDHNDSIIMSDGSTLYDVIESIASTYEDCSQVLNDLIFLLNSQRMATEKKQKEYEDMRDTSYNHCNYLKDIFTKFLDEYKLGYCELTDSEEISLSKYKIYNIVN